MHDSISIFKKETNILIDSFSVNVNNVDRIDIVVGGCWRKSWSRRISISYEIDICHG